VPFINRILKRWFKIKKDNLPWLNSSSRDREEDWSNFFVYFRLAVARILDQISMNKNGKSLN
jgi:hypothetical protein